MTHMTPEEWAKTTADLVDATMRVQEHAKKLANATTAPKMTDVIYNGGLSITTSAEQVIHLAYADEISDFLDRVDAEFPGEVSEWVAKWVERQGDIIRNALRSFGPRATAKQLVNRES